MWMHGVVKEAYFLCLVVARIIRSFHKPHNRNANTDGGNVAKGSEDTCFDLTLPFFQIFILSLVKTKIYKETIYNNAQLYESYIDYHDDLLFWVP